MSSSDEDEEAAVTPRSDDEGSASDTGADDRHDASGGDEGGASVAGSGDGVSDGDGDGEDEAKGAEAEAKTEAQMWASKAGDAAAAAAEAELERQLALVDDPNAGTVGKEQGEDDEEGAAMRAKEAAVAAQARAEADALAKQGPPLHRPRPRRDVPELPPPIARTGEIIIKRGMLRDMNVAEDLVGSGLVELVKIASGEYMLRLAQLDIPNPDHHQIAGACA